MTDPRIILTVVASVISLLALWVVYCLSYRDYRVDLFRQRLFELRDRVFDFARSGELSFDHPAYGILRSTINGFIRFGHRFGMFQIILFVSSIRRRDFQDAGELQFHERWRNATTDLPDSTREKLNQFMLEMQLIVGDQLLFTSPTLMITLVPVITWAILWVLLKTMREQVLARLRTRPFRAIYAAFRRNWIDPVNSAALEAVQVA